MKYLIEFGHSKSDSYLWAVRQCKKLPGYREAAENGMVIHAVEFEDIETFVPIQRLVGGWRNTAYFRDGKSIPADFLWEEYLHKYPPHGSLDMMKSAAAEDAKRPSAGPGSVIIDLDPPSTENVKSLPAPKKRRPSNKSDDVTHLLSNEFPMPKYPHSYVTFDLSIINYASNVISMHLFWVRDI